MYYWLVVWNIWIIFPYIGNNTPIWLIFFQRGRSTTNEIIMLIPMAVAVCLGFEPHHCEIWANALRPWSPAGMTAEPSKQEPVVKPYLKMMNPGKVACFYALGGACWLEIEDHGSGLLWVECSHPLPSMSQFHFNLSRIMLKHALEKTCALVEGFPFICLKQMTTHRMDTTTWVDMFDHNRYLVKTLQHGPTLLGSSVMPRATEAILHAAVVYSCHLAVPKPGGGPLKSDWWFGTFFIFHILGIIIPTDFYIFQRGRSATNLKCICWLDMVIDMVSYSWDPWIRYFRNVRPFASFLWSSKPRQKRKVWFNLIAIYKKNYRFVSC